MRREPRQESKAERLKVVGQQAPESAGLSTFDLQTCDHIPTVWTIAGSDSGAGAGIQADLKVMNAFGVHGCSVITALTAQNTIGVERSHPVSPEMLSAQLEALNKDLPPAAVKTGMLGSAETCRSLADLMDSHFTAHGSRLTLVCDPVLKSTSGSSLLDDDAIDILKKRIFPHVRVLTPNLPETEFLIGHKIKSVEDAARELLNMGCESVLIKGGHAEDNECRDYWTNGTQRRWLSSPRIETKDTHGTGCILSSAIASALALGQSIPDAVTTAKTFLNQCLKSPSGLGAGHGPMMIRPYVVGEIADLAVVGEIADLAVVGGIDDSAPAPTQSTKPSSAPGSAIPATSPASPMPATPQHTHLRRLSNVFAKDPIYFITTNTKDRRKLFNNPDACKILIEEWTGAFERHGWAVGSYVIMPDHVHFFCKPTPEACKLSLFMQQWKQWTSKRIKQKLDLEEPVWQQEFFDHVLRSHESYSEKWNYFEQNPVRAGLVEKAEDWPHAGSIHFK